MARLVGRTSSDQLALAPGVASDIETMDEAAARAAAGQPCWSHAGRGRAIDDALHRPSR